MNYYKIKNIVCICLCIFLTLLFCSCGNEDIEEFSGSSNPISDDTTESAGDSSSVTESSAEGESSVDTTDMFTDRDTRTEYDNTTAIQIKLQGDSIACNSSAVKIEGTTVTIIDEGCYVISGTLNNGMIIVNCDASAKPQLVLNGANVTSKTSAPIYVPSANKVFITLAEGTENSLANGGTFTQIDDNNIDGAIFSKTDLTINGKGKLTLTSPAGHGAVSKDDLVLAGGSYVINCASHGFSANNSVRINGITADITAGKDGIQAEHDTDTTKGYVYVGYADMKITAEGDGISASGYVYIQDGTYNLKSGGGSANGTSNGGGMGGFYGGTSTTDSVGSYKGIKATASIEIVSGSFVFDTADDAVHSNTTVTVNGGSFEISTGDDGFHADETLTVNAGTVNISKCYEGLEALDVLVKGGKISLYATDDGINAAGGMDSSGMGGAFGNDNFGPGGGRPGGRPKGGGMMSSGNGSIVISGGEIYINASGDGIDANGTLEITGGHTVVCGPTRGDTATLDYDKTATISGGTFIGTGASGGMAQTFSTSPQGVYSVSVGNQSAGTKITLTDANGNVVITYTPDLDFGLVILSSPDIVSGQTYTITVGSNSNSFQAK